MFVALSATITMDAVGQASAPPTNLEVAETYAKIVGVAIAFLGFVFGVPLSILHFKKTRAEIRKLELEARSLQNLTPHETQDELSTATIVTVRDSPSANIHVLADPRLRGPMLILLDFICAWIILTLTVYPLAQIVPSWLGAFVIAALAGFLLAPIFFEARRLRRALEPTFDQANRADQLPAAELPDSDH